MFDLNDKVVIVTGASQGIGRTMATVFAESGANVGLYSRMGGGHSHIILVAYENYEMMQLGQNIFASCAASSEMNVAFDKTSVSEDYYNYVTELVLEAGDWRLNTVFSNSRKL